MFDRLLSMGMEALGTEEPCHESCMFLGARLLRKQHVAASMQPLRPTEKQGRGQAKSGSRLFCVKDSHTCVLKQNAKTALPSGKVEGPEC